MDATSNKWRLTLLLAALLVGGFAFRAMTRNTPVTREEAVQQFAEDKREAQRATTATAGKTPRPKPGDGGKGAPARPVVAKHRSAAPAPSAEKPGVDSTSVATTSASTIPTKVPEEGTYAYSGGGRERFAFYERGMPKESFRTIVHQGHRRWSEHHLFSDQRESWTYYSLSPEARLTYSQRNKVVFSKIERDVTLTFSRPLRSSIFPWVAGRTWSGEIHGRASGDESGEVYGQYAASTIEHSTLTIEGRAVETWVGHARLELHGAIEGEVDVTRWLMPSTGLTVREEYDADLELASGVTYMAQWHVQLASLQPID